jgi:hypothetical protein
MNANDPDSFNLVYSGKVLSEGTLSAYGVGKEATIHVQALPPSHFTIIFGDESREITAPGSKSTTIRVLQK